MKRALILLELVCLFGPAIVALCFGAFFLAPMLLASSSDLGGGDWLLGAAVVVCGNWGVVSVANLVFHLIADRHWSGRPVQLLGLGLGVAACSVGVLITKVSLASVIFAGPIAATIHFVVLAKRRRAAS
ncbi:MAG: hypothetical protein NDI93_08025 [Pseudomonas sp.]|nr:hypothetical protein [Pseudomonas sp.]